jgi:hypothetical protein
MFSLDRFYNILHDNLISKFIDSRSFYFYPFGTYQDLKIIDQKSSVSDHLFFKSKQFFHCHFFDQEPLYDYTLPIIKNSITELVTEFAARKISILANSEHSEIKQKCIKNFNMYDWYYFYH